MELRDYQEEDVNYLLGRASAGIFNEQRTGKTPTSLTVMKRKNVQKLLIVCPSTLMYNWYREVKLWYNPYCTIHVITSKKKYRDNYKNIQADVYIINYENIRGSKSEDSLSTLLLRNKFDGLIVDEVHRCKNRKSNNFEAINKLNSIPNRLYLTGTPAPNNQWEVWSILHFINPVLFRSYWDFTRTYFRIKSLPVANRFIEQPVGFKAGMELRLQLLLNEYAVNRKRSDIMQYATAPEPTIIKLELTKEQKRYISELEEWFETEDVMTQGVLDNLIRIRQVCTAPALLNLKGASPKINWFKQIQKDYKDKQIVVFSNSRKFLCMLEDNCSLSHARIDGSVPIMKRGEFVDAFQNCEIQVLLCQTQACKEGLTLDRADISIFMDTYPPASDYQQARDRIVAVSEDNVREQMLFHVMMADSYDEHLYELVDRNIVLTDVINDYKNYLEKRRN